MQLTFDPVSRYPRGTLYRLLTDAYSFDLRCFQHWAADWQVFDDFFYSRLDIADRHGFITALHGEPIGMISWDPRHCPAYVEIGHNGIIIKEKGKGYGKAQLLEALRRIRAYHGLQEIRVETNSGLVARYNYESVGFRLVSSKANNTDTAFSGDYLLYQMKI